MVFCESNKAEKPLVALNNIFLGCLKLPDSKKKTVGRLAIR